MKILIETIPSLLPFIKNKDAVTYFDGETVLYLYEENWNKIKSDEMSEKERAQLNHLIDFFGNGIFAPFD